MSRLSRRDFVIQSVAATAVAQLAASAQLQTQPSTAPTTQPGQQDPSKRVELRWLDSIGRHPVGVTFGVPWPRGMFRPAQSFALQPTTAAPIPLQTWPLATWPDGSLKWTAHAMAPVAAASGKLVLTPAPAPAAPVNTVSVQQSDDAVEIDTGVIRCRLPKRGPNLIESIERDKRPIARNARLVGIRQDQPTEPAGDVRRESFTSNIANVTVEQSGPVRAVVCIEGKHAIEKDRAWLPFTVRLYFYAGSDGVRMMHTFVFDGDETKDFLGGLGVRFDVPMRD